MNAVDAAAAAFVVLALVAASVWIARRITGGVRWIQAPRPATEREQWQADRQASMQAVRDEWTCRQIARLPLSTESDD